MRRLSPLLITCGWTSRPHRVNKHPSQWNNNNNKHSQKKKQKHPADALPVDLCWGLFPEATADIVKRVVTLKGHRADFIGCRVMFRRKWGHVETGVMLKTRSFQTPWRLWPTNDRECRCRLPSTHRSQSESRQRYWPPILYEKKMYVWTKQSVSLTHEVHYNTKDVMEWFILMLLLWFMTLSNEAADEGGWALENTSLYIMKSSLKDNGSQLKLNFPTGPKWIFDVGWVKRHCCDRDVTPHGGGIHTVFSFY